MLKPKKLKTTTRFSMNAISLFSLKWKDKNPLTNVWKLGAYPSTGFQTLSINEEIFFLEINIHKTYILIFCWTRYLLYGDIFS